jgi:hypothetical protein
MEELGLGGKKDQDYAIKEKVIAIVRFTELIE